MPHKIELTDALGVKDIAMPATVERVWRAAQTNPAHVA